MRFFNPSGMPLPDEPGADMKKVDELRARVTWSGIADVKEELMKFTLLTRDRADYVVDRYSERKESTKALMKRGNLAAATLSQSFRRAAQTLAIITVPRAANPSR